MNTAVIDSSATSARIVGTGRRRGRRDASTFGAVAAWVLVLYYGVIFVVPFAVAIWLSFQNWNFIDNQVFVGFRNYQRAVTDSYFWKALATTVIATVVIIVVGIGLSIPLAYFLSRIKGLPQRVLLIIYYLPIMIPTVATVLLWQLLYLPKGGVFNGLLAYLGLPPHQFLASPNEALWSVTAMIVWCELGGGIVLFLAGITAIPGEVLESAELDGAALWRQLWYIVLPMLRPIVFYQVVVSIIAIMQMFTQFQLLPGPAFSTRTLAVYSYELGFQSVDLGYGAAVSVIIFLLLLIATLIQFRRYQASWEG
jgi:multiple sugar transport system permease protein